MTYRLHHEKYFRTHHTSSLSTCCWQIRQYLHLIPSEHNQTRSIQCSTTGRRYERAFRSQPVRIPTKPPDTQSTPAPATCSRSNQAELMLGGIIQCAALPAGGTTHSSTTKSTAKSDRLLGASHTEKLQPKVPNGYLVYQDMVLEIITAYIP